MELDTGMHSYILHGEPSPLYKALEKDKGFFNMFRDFKGYVDFFLLQDCFVDIKGVKV